MNRNLLISTFVALLLLGGIAAFVFSKKRTNNTSQNIDQQSLITPTPTVTVATEADNGTSLTPTATLNSVSTCVPIDLKAQTSSEGAAGSTYVTLTLTNISGKPCTLDTGNFPKITYDETSVKNIKVSTEGTPVVGPYMLNSGAKLSSTVKFPNGAQCSTGIKTVNTTISYKISTEGTATFVNSAGSTAIPLTVCASESDSTTVTITNMSS